MGLYALLSGSIYRLHRLLDRQTQSSAELGFTAILLLSFYSSATLPARWAELNQNRPHAWKWVRFENACRKSGVYPPLKIGGPKTSFSTNSQLNGKRNQSDIHRPNRASVLETTRSHLHPFKMSWTLVHKPTNGFKLDLIFTHSP